MGGAAVLFHSLIPSETQTTMRYPTGSEPDPLYPHSQSMHNMLTFSTLLAVLIGVVLLYLGRRGNVLWLQVWSCGLIAASLCYLVADVAGLL